MKEKRQPTILFIDDEAPWLQALSNVLRGEPYTVIVASSGDEALAKLQKNKPDLIVSDLRMPIMSGFDFFEKVRQNPRFKSVPFVFMSSLDDYDAKRVAKELGADDYVDKPYDTREVKTVLDTLLTRFEIM